MAEPDRAGHDAAAEQVVDLRVIHPDALFVVGVGDVGLVARGHRGAARVGVFHAPDAEDLHADFGGRSSGARVDGTCGDREISVGGLSEGE